MYCFTCNCTSDKELCCLERWTAASVALDHTQIHLNAPDPREQVHSHSCEHVSRAILLYAWAKGGPFKHMQHDMFRLLLHQSTPILIQVDLCYYDFVRIEGRRLLRYFDYPLNVCSTPTLTLIALRGKATPFGPTHCLYHPFSFCPVPFRGGVGSCGIF